jgi:hypothetical protein
MLFEKGSISPELTESMIGAFAPEIIKATRAAQQASSVAPMPANVMDMLQGGQPGAVPPEQPTQGPPPETSTEAPVAEDLGPQAPPQ